MTYKLEPFVEKIEVPVAVILPDGSMRHYINGMQAVSDSFNRYYIIEKISVASGEIVLSAIKAEVSDTGWIGEEKHSFF